MKQWKYRTAVMGLAAVLAATGTGFAFPSVEDFWQLVHTNQIGTVSAEAEEILAQVNQERRSHGLPELSLSQELTKVAQIKAEDMRDAGYFSHTSPTYGSAFDMMRIFGITYRSAGENIAKGHRSADHVMEGWMDSSGHRANILNGSYTHLGVGYCTDERGTTYWVQMFLGE